MTKWKRTFGVHVCCSVLVLAFLVAVPIVATSTAGEAEATANVRSELQKDPLDRLPSSPEEAHQRLEEREIAWPDAGAEGDFGAANVQPGVRVAIPYDTVEGFVSNPEADVEVELQGKGTETVKAGADGWFKADMSAYDIVSGDIVKVTDKDGGPTVNVDCTLTANIDFGNDRVTGATVGSSSVMAAIIAPSTYYADIPPGADSGTTTAAGGGAYTVNFPGLNLRRGDAAFVYSTTGGNTVMNAAAGSGAGLVVYPQYDDVMGFFVPGTALTVNAGAASRNVTTMGDGFFEAWFGNFDITDGTNVNCNMAGGRSIIVRDVTSACDPSTNMVEGTGPASRQMRITMDPYGDPVIYPITSDGSGAFTVNLGANYTATGTDVYNVTWYDDDGDAVVYEFQTYSWYLAEGYTGGEFDTWVLVQNPGPDDAEVVLTFQLPPGSEADPLTIPLPAGVRTSVHLDELPGLEDTDVSTKVTSTAGNWVIAERAVYFDYFGKQGGHDSAGALTPSDTWYLAEGYTGGEFTTWVLVQNPGTEDAMVTFEFQLPPGTNAPDFSFDLPAGTRKSFQLNELPGLGDTDVSTKVTATNPVVAERAVYFDYFGKSGGHDSIGVIAPNDTWYLAEGYTGGEFSTWVLVQNPGTENATVTLEFQLPPGTNAPDYSFDLPAGTRKSIQLNELPNLGDTDVSTKVTATVPVVAERAEYFTYFGKSGGHDSIGTYMPRTTWYLAEGYTGGEFSTWVLVQNPGTENATVTLEFQLPPGTNAPDYSFDLPAGTRKSIQLNELPNLGDTDVSTKVTATVPVVAERAVYFTYDGKQGGHDSIGVPEVF